MVIPKLTRQHLYIEIARKTFIYWQTLYIDMFELNDMCQNIYQTVLHIAIYRINNVILSHGPTQNCFQIIISITAEELWCPSSFVPNMWSLNSIIEHSHHYDKSSLSIMSSISAVQVGWSISYVVSSISEDGLWSISARLVIIHRTPQQAIM